MTIDKQKVFMDNYVLWMRKRMKFRIYHKFSNTKEMFLHFYVYLCNSDFCGMKSTKDIKL